MKKRTIMRCLAIMLLSISTSPILAQKNINKLVEELEKRENIKVSLVTNRNPQTRGITNRIKTFSATDENMLNELVKAFEKDEEYTRTAMKEAKKTNGIHVVEYTYIFTSEEGNYNYSLESSSKTKGKFELTIIFNPSRKKKEKE